MSLFGNLWKRFRNRQSSAARRKAPALRRRRQLFAEPLESRRLLAIVWNLTKTEVPDPNVGGEVIAGQDIQYTIRLQNDGDSPATSVVLTDNLPASTVLHSTVNFPGQDSEGGTIIE